MAINLIVHLPYASSMTTEEEQLRAFGQQLAKLRKERGLTQERFAELLNYDTSTIGRIEVGLRWPRLETLYKMAKVLEVPVADFFNHTRL